MGFPNSLAEARGHMIKSGDGHRTLDRLRLPSWLSFSAITAAASSITIPRPKAVDRPKHKPDLDSTIYQLMSSPVLFDPIRKPRNKIVLCHGLYGFDVRGPASFPKLQLHYWSKVLEILRGKVGAEVEVTGVPGTGSIESRATRLHESLSTRMPNQPINFIAHSMGGLDCRYLISRIRPTEYAPQSLTTVSTPHRGSSFMDWCSANIGVGNLAPSKTAFSLLAQGTPLVPPRTARETETAKNNLGLITSLPQNLTTMLLALLDSPHTQTSPHVPPQHFQPEYARRRGREVLLGRRTRPGRHVRFPPALVTQDHPRRSRSREPGQDTRVGQRVPGYRRLGGVKRRWRGHDGLVSVASARWGEFLGVIEGADHWELRGSSGVSPVRRMPRRHPVRHPIHPAPTDGPSGPNRSRSGRLLGPPMRPMAGTNSAPRRLQPWTGSSTPSRRRMPPTPEENTTPRIKRRSEDGVPVFELERFYVALCKKLYDDGL
ncbi:Triacylglycerol lipase [Rhizoctonia solani]|uniref:Triacylglycerol lipase n=1 Tax=Rhizoctonia solani TaxID=456999 RepID=A0A8H7I9J0_9AGAM|nr:Triacylglycerol lipase [Rhizoctonia solani]